jgi:hypothetical protein
VLLVAGVLVLTIVPLAECPSLTKIDLSVAASNRTSGASQDFVEAAKKIRRKLHLAQGKRCTLCAGRGKVLLLTKWTVPPEKAME